jgi:diguanylate cyclase (GGDEF)-like protein/PAS domain S-box-containing protein
MRSSGRSKWDREEEDLRAINQRLTSVLASIDDLIFVLDSEGRYVEYYQPRDKPELYSPPEQFLGKHITEVGMPESTVKEHLEAINRVRETRQPCQYDYQIPIGSKNRWFSAKVSSLKNLEGKLSGFIVVTRDITERKSWEQQLEMLSITDHLTKAYNRVRFMTALETEARRSRRYTAPLSVVMFDIDHFKKINDNYGHDAGDRVLISITELVKNGIRDTDLLARWGGEEFILLFTHTTGPVATEVVERIRGSIETFNFETIGVITVSFGVTEHRPGDEPETMLKRVDEALYRAKHQGRNRVVYG